MGLKYMMKNRFLWLFIIFMSVLVLVIYWPRRSGVNLIFCDVGQGDGVLLTAGSFQFVYDVGPENMKMAECLGRHVPFWDKKIEFLIISHRDKDHEGGLSQVQRYYKIEQIYYPENLALGDVISNSLMSLKVLSSNVGQDDNERSVVGILYISNKDVLLTGDVPIEIEQRLVWRGVLQSRIDILKVGHHGSRFSTGEELLEVIRPKVAVIGVGKNSYGHPAVEVLDRLEKYGVEVKRTDRDGDVVILID